MENDKLLTDVETQRQRARQHLENGAVTQDYRANRDVVLKLLNEALATEVVCWLRYRRHYFMAKGIHAEVAAAEFLEHSNQEAQHADLLAARIVQLRGAPDFSPDGLTGRSHAEMIRFLGSDDPTTRVLLEGILATEEEHADDLAGLLEGARP